MRAAKKAGAEGAEEFMKKHQEEQARILDNTNFLRRMWEERNAEAENCPRKPKKDRAHRGTDTEEEKVAKVEAKRLAARMTLPQQAPSPIPSERHSRRRIRRRKSTPHKTD